MTMAATAHSAHSAHAQEPTAEQLALAYRHLARPGWPNSVEEAMARHSYATALRQVARTLNRGAWRPLGHTPLMALRTPVPPTPTQPPGRQKTPGSSKPFDTKKAAANDRDDD